MGAAFWGFEGEAEDLLGFIYDLNMERMGGGNALGPQLSGRGLRVRC